MRKTSVILLLAAVGLVGSMAGCKKNPPTPVSELIAKVWTASKVEENGVTVYTRGGTSNVRDYASFKLDLRQTTAAVYTEYNKDTFNGKYALPTDQRLVLSDLVPQPTGSNGTVAFTINSIDESNLKITREDVSVKTGGTKNVYTLTSP